jgi:hypothetical protein
MNPDVMLIAWALVNFWVLGQIWMAQWVVYPLFQRVGAAEYTGYR